ncbi:mitochondrial substrate carrier family protein [Dictyostelium discoideum AX4]|uniref:Mitochondrial substrate carrier family protein V n=1 Tax=Dictyostelium discoideum TaxID=44689 RepID=MCFV_DICDI|nr:mitochondrial substrate carrier family protein [Dictyostelium discoideum AX4]Q551X6.1 RecName: Full=Mitochondrial substrate carrier family protein V [Dictyostelium discoideum]EAL69430.1 mitochondrial substrate carrier family protein [Dictyostelium discoideum AX4]|eukprot:XP_643352.1 mitochondrial substrate carrier family protein [Dictyostelium discoideum AX4]
MNSSDFKKSFKESTENNSNTYRPSKTLNTYKSLKNGNNIANSLIIQLNNNVNNNLNKEKLIKSNNNKLLNLNNNNKNNNNNNINNNNNLISKNGILNNIIKNENQNKILKGNNKNNSNSKLDVSKKSISKENVNYLVSGSIAGAISRSATAGFERLTIIQQVQGMSQNLSQGYVGCIAAMKEMVKREGFKSIWKGNGANIVKVSPNSGIRFLTYEFCKKHFLDNSSNHPSSSSIENGIDGNGVGCGSGSEMKMTVPQTMFSGAMAGLTSTFFTYPLDVVRIRLSLQGSCSNDYAAHRYNGITHSFFKIHKDEGVKGLYKGLGTSIASIVPWVSISFATYEGFKIICKKMILNYQISSSSLSTTTTTPSSINNNNNNNNKNNNSFIYENELGENGINLTNTSGCSTMASTMPSSLLINSVASDENELKKGVNMICDFVCGALSGAVTMTVCYPLDVLRRRMMIQGIGGNKVLYKNGWDATKKILSNEGLVAFYHGIIPAYFKVVPTVAISFAVYEICKDLGSNKYQQK